MLEAKRNPWQRFSALYVVNAYFRRFLLTGPSAAAVIFPVDSAQSVAPTRLGTDQQQRQPRFPRSAFSFELLSVLPRSRLRCVCNLCQPVLRQIIPSVIQQDANNSLLGESAFTIGLLQQRHDTLINTDTYTLNQRISYPLYLNTQPHNTENHR